MSVYDGTPICGAKSQDGCGWYGLSGPPISTDRITTVQTVSGSAAVYPTCGISVQQVDSRTRLRMHLSVVRLPIPLPRSICTCGNARCERCRRVGWWVRMGGSVHTR